MLSSRCITAILLMTVLAVIMALTSTNAMFTQVSEITTKAVSILDFIPSEEHDAITAGTSSYDCAPVIADIIATYAPTVSGSSNDAPSNTTGIRIVFPKGQYTISSLLVVNRDGITFAGEGTLTSVLHLSGSAGKIRVGDNNSTPVQKVKNFVMTDMSIINSGSSTGSPMLDFDLVSLSTMDRVRIKNNNPSTAISTMRMNGYQWIKMTQVSMNGATEHNLIIESADVDNWNAFIHFDTCQFTLGSALTDASTNILFKQSGTSDTTFNAVAFELTNCHLSFYPGNGDYSKSTYGIRFDDNLPSSNNAQLIMTGGGFENQKFMIWCSKAISLEFYSVLFLGNGYGGTAIGDGGYTGFWTFFSCRFLNLVNGIMTKGTKHIIGHNVFTGITGSKLDNFNALTITGYHLGLYVQHITNVAVTAGSTSTSITHESTMESDPVRFSITPTWNTTYYISEVSASGYTINWGTPPTENARVYAESSCVGVHNTAVPEESIKTEESQPISTSPIYPTPTDSVTASSSSIYASHSYPSISSEISLDSSSPEVIVVGSSDIKGVKSSPVGLSSALFTLNTFLMTATVVILSTILQLLNNW